MCILSIRDLNVYYGDKKVLDNINMDIRKNKITAIIGPSGCGKSTLLTTLNRMIEEEKSSKVKGTILFDNTNINTIPIQEVRKDIGMVFQKPLCFPFSIYKNLTYALNYYGVKNREKLDSIVRKSLKAVGLYGEVKDDLKKSALKLSGGQQQRLCIARALTVNPKVLLLDEPCSALDIKNTLYIEKTLLELSQDYTIIIVTHNLNQAKRIADYTAFILDGKLVEYDKTENLFKSPNDRRTREYLTI